MTEMTKERLAEIALFLSAFQERTVSLSYLEEILTDNLRLRAENERLAESRDRVWLALCNFTRPSDCYCGPSEVWSFRHAKEHLADCAFRIGWEAMNPEPAP